MSLQYSCCKLLSHLYTTCIQSFPCHPCFSWLIHLVSSSFCIFPYLEGQNNSPEKYTSALDWPSSVLLHWIEACLFCYRACFCRASTLYLLSNTKRLVVVHVLVPIIWNGLHWSILYLQSACMTSHRLSLISLTFHFPSFHTRNASHNTTMYPSFTSWCTWTLGLSIAWKMSPITQQ